MASLVDYDSDSASGSETAQTDTVAPIFSHAVRKEDGDICSDPQDAAVSGWKRKRPYEQKDDLWAFLVYIPLETNEKGFVELTTAYQRAIENCYGEHLCSLLDESKRSIPLHISLSRCIRIRYVEIDPLMEKLRSRISGSSAFDISLDGCQMFQSDDFVRHFASLLVGVGLHRVLDLIHKVDAALDTMGKPKYYEPPDPHVSFAYIDDFDRKYALDANHVIAASEFTDEKTAQLSAKSPKNIDAIDEKIAVGSGKVAVKAAYSAADLGTEAAALTPFLYHCNIIHIKVGNRLFTIPLNER